MMSYYFSVCSTVNYQETYISFLLEQYEHLNLPYSFQTSLSYITSPILMGKDSIIIWNAQDEPAGAIGFIHGTGEHDYEDRNIIQIQVLFLKKSSRSGRTFLRSMQFLGQHLAQINEPVTELRFWIPAQSALQKLCAKWAVKSQSNATEYGDIEEYRMDYALWHAAVMKYPHELYY
ncbi:hypothetical protein AB4Z29_26810 [Paenibacillus sp. 2TAB23]|uniref:hypothetical protein n=1 Tax=Paenibacillus sp. 2TAB23 TaxID=3233004 RepID=UPI003F9D20EB